MEKSIKHVRLAKCGTKYYRSVVPAHLILLLVLKLLLLTLAQY